MGDSKRGDSEAEGCENWDPEDWEALYCGPNGPGRVAWQAESATLADIVATLEREMAGDYTIIKPIGIGGAGLVVKVRDIRLSMGGPDHFSVLKFSRPVPGMVDTLNFILMKEISKLKTATHQNLIRIESAGTLSNGTNYLIMELLDDPVDADEFVKLHPTIDSVLNVLRAVLDGLAELHGRKIVHMDIKPGNIFVTPQRTVVADLGFAKDLSHGEMFTTNVGGTRGFQHPALRELLSRASRTELDTAEANRDMTSGEVRRSDLKLEWDIYSLGVTLLWLLAILATCAPNSPGSYTFRYLKLMGHRMLGEHVKDARGASMGALSLDGHRPQFVSESVYGLGDAALARLAYRSVDEIRADLNKICSGEGLVSQVPELAEFQESSIQASSNVTIPFSDRVRQLIETTELSALGDIAQLSLVRYIYPTATHTRLEHSLGTFANAARYARALDADPLSPIFKQIMNPRDIEKLLLAALLHDIGHYPLAHDLEEVDREIFSHERRTIRMLEDPEGIAAIIDSPSSGWTAGSAEVAELLRGDVADRSIQHSILESILSGPIDADKLDYLLRDSENLRLPYGRGIDARKLLESLTVIVRTASPSMPAQIGIHDKGKIPAESVAFARYALFGSVYWHKVHRTMKAMLNAIAMEALATMRVSHGDDYGDQIRQRLDDLLQRGRGSEDRGGDPTLFDFNGNGVKRPILDAQSRAIVEWLAEMSDRPAYRRLADQLIERRLYKRILVRTRGWQENSDFAWKAVDTIFGDLAETWPRRRKVNMELNKWIAEKVKAFAANLKDCVLRDECRAFESVHESTPILLVDYPPTTHVGSAGPLFYLTERTWDASGRDELKVDQIEGSSLWVAVSENYERSLGKLRVFCQDEWRHVVRQVVGEDEMARSLSEILQTVSTSRI